MPPAGGEGISSRHIAVATAVALLTVTAGVARSDDPPGSPSDPVTQRGDQFVPKPAGRTEDLHFWYGPYAVSPGNDSNRFDINLPMRNSFVLSVEPGLKYADTLAEPVHQDAHIHHAHWLRVKPGHEEDNHTYGFTRWVFGNGDEETIADSRPRTDADPDGPVYGGYTGPGNVEPMIYMIHNKTARPLNVYIVLHVTMQHGSPAELEQLTGRPYRDLLGLIFGRTYQVPRKPDGDGVHSTSRDDPAGPIEWTATKDGTLIGAGGHLHPGGLGVTLENFGTKERPCPSAGRGGTGGTVLYRGQALWRGGALFSEEFQMAVSHPAWRAPIRRGDRIRLTGVYENRDHAWYDVMTHAGMFFDPEQPPRDGCAPYLIGAAGQPTRHWKRQRTCRTVRVRARGGKTRKRRRCRTRRVRVLRRPDPTASVPNRAWHGTPEAVCGEHLGAPPCNRPEPDRGEGIRTDTVTIANFQYLPGDRALSGAQGAPAIVPKGTSLRFVNADQPLGIRHTVTTCEWPCNGPYVANYPHPDGQWESGMMGYDAIDGGSPDPVAETPKTLEVGRYAYFCRTHPWMRGAFEVR